MGSNRQIFIRKNNMATVFKHKNQEFREDANKIYPYRLFSAFPRLSQRVDAKHLIFDMRQLNPGQFSFPYHFHRNSEELMMVISGEMTLRSPNGFEILKKGDIVFCELGEAGAHQFFNHSEEPCTYLDIRTQIGIDVAEYPDSGKINILPAREIYKKDVPVDYFQGEENIAEKWKALKNKNENDGK
jgi:uncharacterized cupin superfamily protein